MYDKINELLELGEKLNNISEVLDIILKAKDDNELIILKNGLEKMYKGRV